jgi:hypothetical protein
MHPALVRAHLEDSVAALNARLGAHAELGVTELSVDLDAFVLDVGLDHDEHETELITAQSPLLLPGGRALTRQQRIPILGRSRTRRLILRVGVDDFDLLPPTATLLDEARDPLPADQWPTSFSGGGIVSNHPIYHRPFFCRRGLREYHSHEQHEDDPWARWRDALPLQAIIIELLADLSTRWHSAA